MLFSGPGSRRNLVEPGLTDRKAGGDPLGDLAGETRIGAGKGAVRDDEIVGRHVEIVGQQEGGDLIEKVAPRLVQDADRTLGLSVRSGAVLRVGPPRTAQPEPAQQRTG